MLHSNNDHVTSQERRKNASAPNDTMTFARKVAAEYTALETGYRDGRYKFIGRALTCYRKFLRDHAGYDELLALDYIATLPDDDKPSVEDTSRLVVYMLTTAKTNAERNTAGKYARVIDYLHEEGVTPEEAADHVRDEGGIEALLKKARGGETVPNSDRDDALGEDDDDRDEDREDEVDETESSMSSSGTEEIFDQNRDLAVRIKREDLARILDRRFPEKKTFYIECRKLPCLAGDSIRVEGRLRGKIPKHRQRTQRPRPSSREKA